MKMVTLPEMLGDDLMAWLLKEMCHKRLTLPVLREKLEASREILEKRGVDAGYAYYAVQHVLNQSNPGVLS